MPERRLQRTRQAYALDPVTQMMIESNRAASLISARYDTDYHALPKVQIGDTITMRLPSLTSQRTGEETT